MTALMEWMVVFLRRGQINKRIEEGKIKEQRNWSFLIEEQRTDFRFSFRLVLGYSSTIVNEDVNPWSQS
jgi:hypothetical protein